MKGYFTDNQKFTMRGSSVEKYSKKTTINAKIFYILGLKSYKKNALNFISFEESEILEECVYACQFGTGQQYGSQIAFCYEDGRININDTMRNKYVAGDKVKNNAIYDICWVPNKPHIVSACHSGVDQWTTVEGKTSLVNVGTFKGHHKSVTTIDVNSWDPDTFASGSRDGSIILWDSRCHPNKIAAEILRPHCYPIISRKPGRKLMTVSAGINTVNVSCVKFVQSNILASIGSSDGCVKLWDMRKTYKGKREAASLHTFKYPGKSSHNGYTSLSFSPRQNTIYVSCLDNKIYAYHLAYPLTRPVNTFSCSNISSFFVKACLSPCGSYLLCGSDDYTHIWLTETATYNSPQNILPVARLTGHVGEVTNIAWSNDGRDTVVTTGDDLICQMFNVEHKDPAEGLNVDIVGYADPLQHFQSDRPILNVKSNQVYNIRSQLDRMQSAFDDEEDVVRSSVSTSTSDNTEQVTGNQTSHTNNNRNLVTPITSASSLRCDSSYNSSPAAPGSILGDSAHNPETSCPSGFPNLLCASSLTSATTSPSTSANTPVRICHSIGGNSNLTTVAYSCATAIASSCSLLLGGGVGAPSAINANVPSCSSAADATSRLQQPSTPTRNITATTPRGCGTNLTCGTAVSFKTPKRNANTLTPWISLLTEAAKRRDCLTPPVADTTSRKKEPIGSKKRLTDYLENNQENLLREGSKLGKSPTKHILTTAAAANGAPAMCAAVSREHEPTESADANKAGDFMEGVKPLDGVRLPLPFAGLAGIFDAKTPVKSVTDYQCTPIKSPLADLPNYVLDGSSPHHRPEKLIVRKRKDDWLTSLSASKRFKSAAKLIGSDDDVTPKKIL